MSVLTSSHNKYKISRRGRKLQVLDDQRTLIALPKDVPERTWAEILQKEENELYLLDIREEILEDTFATIYEQYMVKQSNLFTVHCATEAWLKLIDWQFYRHDPGEETSAYPPSWIPKRKESWIPDEMPDPSPKDTWAKHKLHVVEDMPDVALQKWPSSSSLDIPVVEEIPSEYWFPGKINVPSFMKRVKKGAEDATWHYVQESGSGSRVLSDDFNTESEVLQKVTDYSTEEMTEKESLSSYGELKTTTPVEDEQMQGSLIGAGDSTVAIRPKKRYTETKSKSIFSKSGFLPRIGASNKSRLSKATLPALDIAESRSRISVISDCRLRNLRLETQYEITSEKVDTPPGETVKRK